MWFQRHEEPKVITDDYEQVFSPVSEDFTIIFHVSGNVYLFRLREMGSKKEGMLYIRVPLFGRQGIVLIHPYMSDLESALALISVSSFSLNTVILDRSVYGLRVVVILL